MINEERAIDNIRVVILSIGECLYQQVFSHIKNILRRITHGCNFINMGVFPS